MSEAAFFDARFRVRTFLIFGVKDDEKNVMAHITFVDGLYARFVGMRWIYARCTRHQTR